MAGASSCINRFLSGFLFWLFLTPMFAESGLSADAGSWGGVLSGGGPLAETDAGAAEQETWREPALSDQGSVAAEPRLESPSPTEAPRAQGDRPDPAGSTETSATQEPPAEPASPVAASPSGENRQGPTFPIRKFEVAGNSLYPEEILDEVLKEFIGPARTADDVERSRARLEGFYRETGYVRVLVNVPEQEVADGVIRLQVTESRIGNVLVTGNRYFTREAILKALPALQSGKALYVPEVEKQLKAINKTDLSVKLGLQPGRELGVDDVELKVVDRLPLHGRLEVSNRASHNTSELRFNGMVRYDNLWQKGHSASLQYQTAPAKPEEVQVLGASYVRPVPWAEKHLLAVYSLWTDSDTAFGDEFSVTGKGFIAGLRYLVPLAPLERYYHSVSFGLDYKDFDETIGFEGEDAGSSEAPISYLPFAVEYNGAFLDNGGGTTRLKGSLSWAFRDLVGDQEEFANKRLYARGDYLSLKLGLKRGRKLPWGTNLGFEIDGQVASEPLISSEQFSAGGTESVRGYRESDSLGDAGMRASLEWRMPELGKASGATDWRLTPYLFHDFAWLKVRKPQAEQTGEFRLNGSGIGLRGSLWQDFEYQADLAWTSSATDRTGKGTSRCHFFIKYIF